MSMDTSNGELTSTQSKEAEKARKEAEIKAEVLLLEPVKGDDILARMSVDNSRGLTKIRIRRKISSTG